MCVRPCLRTNDEAHLPCSLSPARHFFPLEGDYIHSPDTFLSTWLVHILAPLEVSFKPSILALATSVIVDNADVIKVKAGIAILHKASNYHYPLLHRICVYTLKRGNT